MSFISNNSISNNRWISCSHSNCNEKVDKHCSNSSVLHLSMFFFLRLQCCASLALFKASPGTCRLYLVYRACVHACCAYVDMTKDPFHGLGLLCQHSGAVVGSKPSWMVGWQADICGGACNLQPGHPSGSTVVSGCSGGINQGAFAQLQLMHS